MSTMPLRLSGAVPAKDTLCVVTLSLTGPHLRLVPTMSSFFAMPSDDQAGVRGLASELVDFFSTRDIDRVIVRRGPATGPRPSSAGSIKMETVLQLLPVPCVNVHVQRVNGWVNAGDWLLPLSQVNLRPKQAELQKAAIQTAAFGIACILTQSSFGSG